MIALEEAGVTADPPSIDVYFLFADDVARPEALAQMALLRDAGIACDAEYAGRSLKGQRTQLARSGARGYVLVSGEEATLRRSREEPEMQVRVDEIAARWLAA